MLLRSLIFIIFGLYFNIANASTITFKDIPYFSLQNYYDESGFRIEGLNGDFGGFGGEHLHVDSRFGGGPYADTFSLYSLSSRAFSLQTMDLLGYFYSPESGLSKVSFTGYLLGTVVASSLSFIATGAQTVYFGQDFALIDRLLIEAECVFPTDGFCGVPFDVHFNIDNIRVSEIPLPAGGLLLLSAIVGGLGLLRFRNCKLA